jgi:hypothetical protein
LLFFSKRLWSSLYKEKICCKIEKSSKIIWNSYLSLNLSASISMAKSSRDIWSIVSVYDGVISFSFTKMLAKMRMIEFLQELKTRFNVKILSSCGLRIQTFNWPLNFSLMICTLNENIHSIKTVIYFVFTLFVSLLSECYIISLIF